MTLLFMNHALYNVYTVLLVWYSQFLFGTQYVNYLLWQVWVSICLQQLLNNVPMFMVYCKVEGSPPQLSV